MKEEELSPEELQTQLDKEGDLAADYLEELLDIADLDGDLEISTEAERATVAIVNEEGKDRRLKRLIGRRGEVLDSLQELTRLAVQQETGDRSRLMLDVLGYREQHRDKIREIAQDAVEEVLDTGEEYALQPMNPFERKVVHDVAAAAGLVSESEGFGANRHVVLHLAEDEDELAAEYADSAAEGDFSAESMDSAESAESAESAISADSAE